MITLNSAGAFLRYRSKCSAHLCESQQRDFMAALGKTHSQKSPSVNLKDLAFSSEIQIVSIGVPGKGCLIIHRF